MIKLIASDIDGTLVKDGSHELNPELYGIISALHERGIQFAAASGRQWISIEKLFSPVCRKIFYLSDNGSYIGCCGRSLFLNTIDRDMAVELIRDIRSVPGLEVMVSGPDVIYLDTKDEEFLDWCVHGYRFRIRQVKDVAEVDDRIIKVSAYKKHGIQAATTGIVSRYSDRMKVSVSGDMWLDCMARGVSKGHAIATLQESLDIRPEETMVFGDQMNDLEMMDQAYYSFAVGNARPEVKAAARFRADTNQNDGVLKILKCL